MVKTKTTSKTTQEIYKNWYKEVYVKNQQHQKERNSKWKRQLQ